MPQAHRSQIRRVVTYAALGTLLGAASLTLSQCTQVGDSLTGVSLISNKRVSCKHECDATFHTQAKIEHKLHRENLRLCEGLSDPSARKTCREAEQDRFLAALDALEAQRRACRANCHKQGGGSAG